jgi:tetratricopeptide (TPR) repeat protein
VERRRARQGLAAGVSTLLAVAAGALTNVATSGWTWSLGVSLAVLVVGWIGFEVWRAGRTEYGRVAADVSGTDSRGEAPLAESSAAERDLRQLRGGHDPNVPSGVGQGGRLAQLPMDTAIFTGRTSELAHLLALIDEILADRVGGAVVICAIDGMAGIGKTALAVHASHRLSDRFPDGCLFLDLHGYTESIPPVEPGQALQRLLSALNVPGEEIPAEVDDQAALYRNRLVGRRMLIVLDNARTAEQVRPLLPASPGCLVLVTSRRRLIALDEARSLSLDVLPVADAVALFRRIAGQDRIAGQADAVERVVQLCGRLPLAVRIAAARLRARPAWTVRDLFDQLADQQAIIGEFDDGERSVFAALALSYGDLGEDRQRMFRRLSLHPGTDTDVHAAAALDGLDTARGRRLLEDLLDAHLLIQAVAGRYRFHDLVRAYALHLVHTEDLGEVRRACLTRLLDHYIATAAAAVDVLYPAEIDRRPHVGPPSSPTPRLTTPEAAVAWLDAERANLIAACAHAIVNDQLDYTIRFSAILRRYLQYGGYHADGLAVHTQAREAARRSGDRGAEANAVMYVAVALEGQGRYPHAADHLRQALELFQELGDRIGQARTLNNLGYVHWRIGPYDVAAGFLQRALTICRELHDHGGEAHALDGLGMVCERQGRDVEAAAHFRRALRLFRELGEYAGEAGVLASLGCIASRQHRHQEAIDHHQQALVICRRFGNRVMEAHAINNLGLDYRRQGNYEEAARQHEHAMIAFREIGDRGGESEAHNGLGETLLAAGDPPRAKSEHAAALMIAAEIGDRYEQARAHAGLANAHQAVAQLDQANYHRHEALAIYNELGVPATEETRAHIVAELATNPLPD